MSQHLPSGSALSAPDHDLRVLCARCGKRVRIPPHCVGKKGHCPRCKEPIPVILLPRTSSPANCQPPRTDPPHHQQTNGRPLPNPPVAPSDDPGPVPDPPLTALPGKPNRSTEHGDSKAPEQVPYQPYRDQQPAWTSVWHLLEFLLSNLRSLLRWVAALLSALPRILPSAPASRPAGPVSEVAREERIEHHMPEAVTYRPNQDRRPARRSSGISPKNLHSFLRFVFRWPTPFFVFMFAAAVRVGASHGAPPSPVGLIGVFILPLVVFRCGDPLARRLTAWWAPTFSCPGCHSVFEAVARWHCACGYHDHKDRHYIRFRCPMCRCGIGHTQCQCCNATIFLQRGKRPSR